jgi:lycopene beta-cyclase
LNDADLILVGGGLANLLIALRLAETMPALKILILEKDSNVGGNHTWSYHGSDVTPEHAAWLKPLNSCSWQDYMVRFPQYERKLSGTYHSLFSDKLAAIADTRLKGSVTTGAEVIDLQAQQVRLGNGSTLCARAVIDGRGPVASKHLDVRFQKFVGWEVELAEDHRLEAPVIMDATIDQDDGYRFFYCLPFTRNTLLIEDTHYSDGPTISTAEYGAEIERYAEQRGWRITRQLRSEEGVLPITLGGDIGAFWNDAPIPVPRSGLRAALFHPATGYSLPNAIRLAWNLSATMINNRNWTATTLYECTRQESLKLWNSTAFYRALNRMLFLAASPTQRRAVLQRFYGLNNNLIARFYAGANTPGDKLRILAGKPPVALGPAFNSVFRYRPPAENKPGL